MALNSVNGKNVFANEKLIGQDDIEVSGTREHPHRRRDERQHRSQRQPDALRQPPTRDRQNGADAELWQRNTEGNKNLPPITPPANIATENDNCRLAQNCSGAKAGKVDTFSQEKSLDRQRPRSSTSAGRRTLTMGGNDYLVCGLFVNAGKIFMAAGAHVRIFVDTPAHCGLASGAIQVEIKGNGNIESTGYNPQQGLYDVPGIYMLGNGAVNLAGNSGANELMLYAPEQRSRHRRQRDLEGHDRRQDR